MASDDPINNQGLWKNQEYRDLVAQGVAVADGPERDAIYEKAEQIMADDVGILPISHPTILAATRPNISGFSIHPIALTFMRNVVKQ